MPCPHNEITIVQRTLYIVIDYDKLLDEEEERYQTYAGGCRAARAGNSGNAGSDD